MELPRDYMDQVINARNVFLSSTMCEPSHIVLPIKWVKQKPNKSTNEMFDLKNYLNNIGIKQLTFGYIDKPICSFDLNLF